MNRLRAWCVDAEMEATLTEHLSRLILASLTIFLSFVSLSECFDFSRLWTNQGRSAGIITHWCPNQNGTSQLSDYCLIFVWAPFVIKSWFNELKFMMIYAFPTRRVQNVSGLICRPVFWFLSIAGQVTKWLLSGEIGSFVSFGRPFQSEGMMQKWSWWFWGVISPTPYLEFKQQCMENKHSRHLVLWKIWRGKLKINIWHEREVCPMGCQR